MLKPFHLDAVFRVTGGFHLASHICLEESLLGPPAGSPLVHCHEILLELWVLYSFLFYVQEKSISVVGVDVIKKGLLDAWLKTFCTQLRKPYS